MQIGLSIFPTTYSIHPVRLAREAEARGFESIFMIEHTHVPASRDTPHPPGGDLPSIYREGYDPFVALAQAAAVTEQLEIGTGICIVPEHHSIELAKLVAFEDRWAVTREWLLAMKECWTKKDAEFHGKFTSFDPVWVEPKPVQTRAAARGVCEALPRFRKARAAREARCRPGHPAAADARGVQDPLDPRLVRTARREPAARLNAESRINDTRRKET